ncbi:MAG: hypothetical protein VKJ02_07285 [Snowella sp.]|nr:hypothetical protein [Snowella sp.]
MPSTLNHFTTSDFWELYYQLPPKIQDLADKNYALLKENPRHPSLHFKKICGLWSVRVGKQFRALGFEEPEGIVWFWIGSHQEYDEILKKSN